jgi:hypothetical protein
VTPDEIAQASVIFGVAHEHLDWVARHYPEASARTYLLTDLIGAVWDIDDPGLQDLEPLRGCRDAIDRVIIAGLNILIDRARGSAR